MGVCQCLELHILWENCHVQVICYVNWWTSHLHAQIPSVVAQLLGLILPNNLHKSEHHPSTFCPDALDTVALPSGKIKLKIPTFMMPWKKQKLGGVAVLGTNALKCVCLCPVPFLRGLILHGPGPGVTDSPAQLCAHRVVCQRQWVSTASETSHRK